MTATLDHVRPGPGRPCTVCEHPERAAIDDDLRCGVRFRAIARRFGLTSHENVRRHASSHLQVGDAPPATQDATDPERLKARILELEERLHRWLDAFEEAGAAAAALRAAQELRKTLELLARIGGQLDQQILVVRQSEADLVLRALRRSEDGEAALLESLGASPELVAGFRAGRPGVVRGAFIETTSREGD